MTSEEIARLNLYNLNANQLIEEGYDLVVFRCQNCADELEKYNPYIYKENQKTIPLNKIKIVIVDLEDCENYEKNIHSNPQRNASIRLTLD